MNTYTQGCVYAIVMCLLQYNALSAMNEQKEKV